MRNEVRGEDYFTVPRQEHLVNLAYQVIAPLLAARGVHPNAALDVAKIAVEKNLVEVEPGGNGKLHKFNGEGLIFELEQERPWLVSPQTHASEQPRGPQRHPALTDPRDPSPGTPEYAALDPLRKLKIANQIAAHDLEVRKRQQATKKTS